jgi:NitT/TauT family transport system permease protein
MKPLAPISNTVRLALGILFFVLFFAAWGYATLGGYVSKTFLADPLTMLEEGWLLLTKHGFLGDIGITIWRVVGGFVLAALVAVPIGILMGAYKPIEAFLEPFVSFARYLPASAFIPLLILWAGLGELQKLLVIFIGSVFQIVLIVAELIGSSSGIGHMITDSQALLATGQIIFGIIVIGVIGLISDFLFKWGNRQLFPWSLA